MLAQTTFAWLIVHSVQTQLKLLTESGSSLSTAVKCRCHLEVVSEVGSRCNRALRDVTGAVVPLIAPHGESMPVNGDAIACTWVLCRNVIEHIDLHDRESCLPSKSMCVCAVDASYDVSTAFAVTVILKVQ